jgi:hypothetical protein
MGGSEMPIPRRRITAAEMRENCAILARLKQMGIVVGDDGNLCPRRDRIIFQAINPEFSRIYDLPSGEVAVVLLTKLCVLKSGPMVLDACLTLPWDDCPLDLEDPKSHRYFSDVVQGLPYHPPTILNEWMVGTQVPLRPCQRDGVLIGTGWSRIPLTYPDEAKVRVRLSLLDDRQNEIDCEFVARVDRSLVRGFERRRQERLSFAPLARTGLYGGLRTETRRRPTSASKEHFECNSTNPNYGRRVVAVEPM